MSGNTLSGADAGNYNLIQQIGLKADIGKAILTVSATGENKVYDGTTGATVTLIDNRIAGDILTITNSGASFLDKNVASGKTVNVSGINVSGSDSGNYTVNTTAATHADITVRSLSTWNGTGDGLWSNPANWDALPDGNNVLAVYIPGGSTGTVTYDASAGTTHLQSMTSAQTLALSGGTLDIGSQLSTSGYRQSGGSLTGTGNLNVTSAFAQTGGSIVLGGNAVLKQSVGNLNVGNLTAASVALSASEGAITQTGPIVANLVATDSTDGTVLADAGNRIGAFTAVNSRAGDIVLTNTAVFSVASVSNAGSGAISIDNTGAMTTGASPIESESGPITLAAHSPLTIGSGGITTAGPVALSAGPAGSLLLADVITFNGPVTAGGPITLAGNSVSGSHAPTGSNVVTHLNSTADTLATINNATVSTATTLAVNDLSAVRTTPVAPNGLMPASLPSQQNTTSTATVTSSESTAFTTVGTQVSSPDGGSVQMSTAVNTATSSQLTASDSPLAQPTNPPTDSGAKEPVVAVSKETPEKTADGAVQDKDSKKNDKDEKKSADKDQPAAAKDKKDAPPKKNYCN